MGTDWDTPSRFPTEFIQRATNPRMVGRKVSIHYWFGVRAVICNSESVCKYAPARRRKSHPPPDWTRLRR